MEKPKRIRIVFTLIIPALCILLGGPARADEVQLAPDHPDRYTVQKGDTLWDISTRFLKSPWQWPKIWKANDQIKNPHLIYPGDVVVLRYVNGQPELTVLRNEKMPLAAGAPEEKPTADAPLPPLAAGSTGRTEKLSPSLHVESLDAAIPTIPPNAILPFLTYPLAISENELEKAGYITTGLDDRIALGDGSEFYARGLKANNDEFFHIFRRGDKIKNPETGELLAYEAVYLGDARKLEPGDPSKLVVTSVRQEIQKTDRLLSAPPRASLPYYYPSAPTKQVHGYIALAVNGVAEIGSLSVVAITLGKRDGMQEGHVLRVMRHAGEHRDPVTRDKYKLPEEESGLVMIFRVYDKVSYALVMRSTRPIHIRDAVVTP